MNVNLLEVEFENLLLFYRSGETIISVYLLSSTEINDTFITRIQNITHLLQLFMLVSFRQTDELHRIH